MVNEGRVLRSERMAAGIPGRMVSSRANISRSKLSEIESGQREPTEGELKRIREVLRGLIGARSRVVEFAREVDWPM